jgi:hypothetical protein
MPDWSYRTVLRPILFAAAPATGRDFALSCMGRLSRLPLGPTIIDWMGHMRPDPRLACSVAGAELAGRIGLGSLVDPQLRASSALARFGIGFLEIGPLTAAPVTAGAIDRDAARETLTFHEPAENPGFESAERSLQRLSGVAVFVRLVAGRCVAGQAADDREKFVRRLAPHARGFVLAARNLPDDTETVVRLAQEIKRHGRIVLVSVSIDASESARQTIDEWVCGQIVDGVSLDNRRYDAAGGCRVDRPDMRALADAVGGWRRRLPAGAVILASGFIYEPCDALALVEAGADLASVDGGLIFTGPGLVKRCNEALLYRMTQQQTKPALTEPPARLTHYSWFWTLLMGLGMLFGGVLATAIAHTRVVMPYDEMISGLNREKISAINARLLDFMAHDRVTLSGTMLSVGILYSMLSFFGSRRGMHWAQVAVVLSASCGFASFFLFLGFGYFDPFHAFVTAVLFQVLLMAAHCDLPAYRADTPPESTNDRAWRRSQWGQLIFILHGATIISAGCVICVVGMTSVFVHDDLAFMQTTAELLTTAHPSLVPLVAHDRATWGGMLISVGVCVLLSSLWGFRRGNAWLWWALVVSGTTAYASTIAIHWDVGYTSPHHLLPAYAGFVMLGIGAALSYGHLCSET